MYPPVPPGAPPIDHHWEAGPDDVSRLASAAVRSEFGRLGVLVSVIAIIAAGLFTAAVAALVGNIVMVVYGLGIVVAVAALFAVSWLRVRRHMAGDAFPGARWAIGYGPTGVSIYQPTMSAVFAYSVFKSADRAPRNTVILRYAHSRQQFVLPGELCPPAALAFVTDAINRSRAQ